MENEDVGCLKQKTVKDLIRKKVERRYQEDSFYVCDADEIVEKHRVLKKYLPRVFPYYGVRANNDRGVLQVLAQIRSVGFDCASKYEMDQVLSFGVRPSRIILSNPMMPFKHRWAAQEAGVEAMIFDGEFEIEKISLMHETAKALIAVDFEEYVTQEAIQSIKIGCSPREAMKLITKAKEQGLDLFGISIRINHNNHNKGDLDPYERAFQGIQKLFAWGAKIGYDLHIIDIGGGFPENDNDCVEMPNELMLVEKPFDEVAGMTILLDKYFPKGSTRIYARPGRYYVRTAYTLACYIHSLKDVSIPDSIQISGSENKEEKFRMYYINEGVFSSFSNKYIRNNIYTPQPLATYSERDVLPCCIWGQTCDGLDVVVEEHMSLPAMEVGNWILFEQMGAYTRSQATGFNGYPIPQVIFVRRRDDCLVTYPVVPRKRTPLPWYTNTTNAVPRRSPSFRCFLRVYVMCLMGMGAGLFALNTVIRLCKKIH